MLYRRVLCGVCVKLLSFLSLLSAAAVAVFCSFARARTFVSRFCDDFIDLIVILWFWTVKNTQRTICIQSRPHLNRMHDFPGIDDDVRNLLWKSVPLEIQHKINLRWRNRIGRKLSWLSHFIVLCVFFSHKRTLTHSNRRQGKQLLFVNKTQHFNSIRISCSKREIKTIKQLIFHAANAIDSNFRINKLCCLVNERTNECEFIVTGFPPFAFFLQLFILLFFPVDLHLQLDKRETDANYSLETFNLRMPRWSKWFTLIIYCFSFLFLIRMYVPIRK